MRDEDRALDAMARLYAYLEKYPLDRPLAKEISLPESAFRRDDGEALRIETHERPHEPSCATFATVDAARYAAYRREMGDYIGDMFAPRRDTAPTD